MKTNSDDLTEKHQRQATCRTDALFTSHPSQVHHLKQFWPPNAWQEEGNNCNLSVCLWKWQKIRGIMVEELSLEFNKLHSRFIS